MIFDYTRGTHRKYAIRQNYEKIDLSFVTFRDLNSDSKNDSITKEYNDNIVKENNILSKYNNHTIYILLDATHEIWLHPVHKKQIMQTLKSLYN